MTRLAAALVLLFPSAAAFPTPQSSPLAVTSSRVHGNAASTSGPDRVRPAETFTSGGRVGKLSVRATIRSGSASKVSSIHRPSERPAAPPTPRRAPAARANRDLRRPPLAEETRWRSPSAKPSATTTASSARRTSGGSQERSASTSAGTSLSDLQRAEGLPEPWRSIVRCESLGDGSWRVASSSMARGFFQFLRSTWTSLGLSGDPAAASFADQYAAARRLRARDGIGAWDCARQLGLA